MYKVRETKRVVKNNDVLLITGDGKTLIKDIDRFLALGTYYDTMAIGRSIKVCPGKVDHYADVDADAGKNVCDTLYQNNPDKGKPIRHTLGDVEWFDVGWDLESTLIPSDEIMWHGSTALFCVLIGLAMGYLRIVLAGCPLDSKGHWYFSNETKGPVWTAESYQSWLEFAMRPESGIVRSMSGYTKVILGEPDWFWIKISDDEREKE